MEKLRTYKVEYSKTVFESIEIKAENDQDAKNIADMKCPKGFHPILTIETSKSIVDRTFNNK
jgi:hypothetical protein